MTTMQRVARLSGWVFVLIGIWGAAIAGMSMESDPTFAPRLWGLFPVNFAHNLAHLGLGLWGLLAASSPTTARAYGVGAGAVYALLAVLGLFFPSGLGVAPIGDNGIWLHAILGVALLAAGVTLGPRSTPTIEPAAMRTVRPPGESSPRTTTTRPAPESSEDGVDESSEPPERMTDRAPDGRGEEPASP